MIELQVYMRVSGAGAMVQILSLKIRVSADTTKRNGCDPSLADLNEGAISGLPMDSMEEKLKS